MYRPGANPDDIRMEDVLCDFCHKPWREDVPMIEGHRGAVVCGQCLTLAWTDVVLGNQSTAPPGSTCRMCLETRDENAWQSPAHPDAVICRRCIKQSGVTLERDPDFNWQRPR